MEKVRRRKAIQGFLVTAGLLTAAGITYVVISPRPRRAVVTAPAERAYAEAVRLWKGEASVADRLREFGEPARARLRSHFRSAGVAYPPETATLVAFKQEKKLHLYAPDAAGKWRMIYSYPILAASGRLGPKLRRGDYQVPEGVYRVTYLNPNSHYHVSLRLNYPNAFDRAQGTRNGHYDSRRERLHRLPCDGRRRLGRPFYAGGGHGIGEPASDSMPERFANRRRAC